MSEIRKVDQNAGKTAQLTTIVLLLLAFVIGNAAWWLVAFVAVAQLMGALALPYAPYALLYRAMLSARLLQPNPQPDNPEPHRFSLGLGALFNGVGALLIVGGVTGVGWVLVWVVIALANLNFWLNFCVGCWMYYQLNRLGVPGFSVAPIQKT